jgi:hypothetical protein
MAFAPALSDNNSGREIGEPQARQIRSAGRASDAGSTPPETAGEGLDPVHRVLTGQTLTRKELMIGGFVVAIWFVMDLVQWLDWLVSKFR